MKDVSKLIIIAEIEDCQTIMNREQAKHNDHDLLDEKSPYPWQGALIACGVSAIMIFVFIIPWVIGGFNILTW